jgi:hypothetical protein
MITRFKWGFSGLLILFPPFILFEFPFKFSGFVYTTVHSIILTLSLCNLPLTETNINVKFGNQFMEESKNAHKPTSRSQTQMGRGFSNKKPKRKTPTNARIFKPSSKTQGNSQTLRPSQKANGNPAERN